MNCRIQFLVQKVNYFRQLWFMSKIISLAKVRNKCFSLSSKKYGTRCCLPNVNAPIFFLFICSISLFTPEMGFTRNKKTDVRTTVNHKLAERTENRVYNNLFNINSRTQNQYLYEWANIKIVCFISILIPVTVLSIFYFMRNICIIVFPFMYF